jgi:hypothetical protein
MSTCYSFVWPTYQVMVYLATPAAMSAKNKATGRLQNYKFAMT